MIKKNPKYVVFAHNEKVLCKYTVKGTFMGEMEATLSLLASENNINKSDIRIYTE